MSAAPLNLLVEKIRAAHPGSYDDMDDATLTKRVLAKYPQYSDLAAPKLSAPANPILADQSQDMSAEGLVKGAAKNLYQVSAPGIAVSLLEKKAPQMAAKLPARMRQNAAPAEQLPGQIVMNAAPMMLGDEAPIPQRPQVTPQPSAVPAAAAEGPGLMGKIARHMPYIGKPLKALDMLQELIGKGEAPAAPPTPSVPDVPANWGKGEYGTPVAEWGKKVAPSETPAAPKPIAKSAESPVYRDATLNRRNFPDHAGEDFGELKKATADLVDSAVPSSTNHGVNLMTKAQIDMKLRAGDVSGAEQILDSAAKKVTPGYMAPERPEIVPATQNIRENEALAANSQQKGRTGGYREAQDDAGVSQEMRGNLDRHGVMAEQEARREFIARNSLGTTKGEMAQQVTTKPVDPNSLSLEEKLRIMLEAARAAKQ